ncbi:mitochondrial carrier superfamily protein [Toxoplasma gondii TgCatPRC2]|uniref:Mitochondrial carrier superfamily protein n=3 Tax=Toxoplasma gondii TaxID=5811 RepID=A0A151H750_TOXGO|nr:mitochondrial carrier superfamily protein [Toxoplasma gondii TgCatPRC2]PIM02917.1 mitochondrial carrier superfamily protein [Toxoplasma gondii COUG]
MGRPGYTRLFGVPLSPPRDHEKCVVPSFPSGRFYSYLSTVRSSRSSKPSTMALPSSPSFPSFSSSSVSSSMSSPPSHGGVLGHQRSGSDGGQGRNAATEKQGLLSSSRASHSPANRQPCQAAGPSTFAFSPASAYQTRQRLFSQVRACSPGSFSLSHSSLSSSSPSFRCFSPLSAHRAPAADRSFFSRFFSFLPTGSFAKPQHAASPCASPEALAQLGRDSLLPLEEKSEQRPSDVLYVFQRGEFLHALLHTLAGVSGATVAMILVYPLDLLRTEQTVKGIGAGSMREEALLLIRRKGWRGMYRGLTSSLWGVVVSWGVYFFIYSYAKAYLQKRGFTSKGMSSIIIAVAAGICSTIASNPFWVANTRIKLGASRHTTDVWRMLGYILRREGLRGWFAGLLPALMLVSNPAIQFVLYDFLKDTLTAVKEIQASLRAGSPARGERSPQLSVRSLSFPSASSESSLVCRAQPGQALPAVRPLLSGAGKRHAAFSPSLKRSEQTVSITVPQKSEKNTQRTPRGALSGGEAFAIGLIAKLCATLATYPYLVVKTRAQTKLHNVHDNSASFRCLLTILETEGVGGLYTGLQSKLVATLLSSAVMFSVYEKLLPSVEHSLQSLSAPPSASLRMPQFLPFSSVLAKASSPNVARVQHPDSRGRHCGS